MPENDPKITELEDRLDLLVRTQIDFQKEVLRIRSELAGLRAGNRIEQEPPPIPPTAKPAEPIRSSEPGRPRTEPRPYPRPERPVAPPTFGMSGERSDTGSPSSSEGAFSQYVSSYAENARADLEKFIGENLISKIGIIVLVLGVAIGAKYAIDNNLISPLTRIIIGYIFGFGLVGLAIKLKLKYLNFSAVLISGGMAIMYFVTYFAYSSYGLIPQSAAFALMAMFTAFTVPAALVYDRQVIAHIGLVGAYAVPFLLSDDSGNYLFLFAYMAILNAGILAISIKKYWKPLFYTSSAFTWLVYFGWFVAKYRTEEHFYLALVSLAIFFAIFYATKIVHGVLLAEGGTIENTVSALGTSVIFFGFCLAISDVSTGAGRYWAFFTYLAVISLGLLLTSFRFYGRLIVYLTFVFTWLIFGVWFLNHYRIEEHFYIAGVFAAVFFAIFYGTILAQRLIADNLSFIENTSLVLTNSFLFYGFGYSILNGHETLSGYLGPYTAAHAGLHFAVAQMVNRFRSSAADVIQVLTILILTFASIAIPVQFDGNYVTLIWSLEACLLFWFGRVRQIRLFEYFSYPVMVLATGSMFLDWLMSFKDRNAYSSEFALSPISNGDFVTAAILVAAFAFIYITNRDDRYERSLPVDLVRAFGLAIAAVGTFVLYNMFRLEIENYFHLKALEFRSDSLVINIGPYNDLERFNFAWQLNYTLLFLTAMATANLKTIRSTLLAFVNSGLGAFTLTAFATIGMFVFSDLRQAYIADRHEPVFTAWLYIAIRPISYIFAAGLLYSFYRYSRDRLLTEKVPESTLLRIFEAVVYTFVFIVASCELINLMAQFHIPDAYKLGLSVLWGVYALVLIVLGIAWNKKHIRIGAIVLLAVTLIKLFLYDIADLDTIPKTILFVTLGTTMLVVSFLYNKYKSLILTSGTEGEE